MAAPSQLPETAELSQAKQLLLERLRQGRFPREALSREVPLVARHQSAAPLSFGQEQVWLVTQLRPDVPMYNECVTVRHAGPTNVAALEWSLNEILRRHEAWRTTFTVSDARPIQRIQPHTPMQLPVVDLRALEAPERESEALRMATEDAQRPIDMERGPLLRATLVLVAEGDSRLYLTMHHIIFDGVALYNVFLPELAALYEARCRGAASPLPDPPVQYADFSAWQREALPENGLAQKVAYWRHKLGESPAELQLPADFPRPPVQSYHGSLERVALSRDFSQRLRDFSNAEGVTLFITLLTAFGVLLQRYSGQDDFLLGTVTAGRNRTELRGLLGYFLNVILFRVQVPDQVTVRDLLLMVRASALDAYSHDEVPFDLLLRELGVKRTQNKSPLFQVMFSLEPPITPLSAEWSLSQLDVDTGTAKFDLSMELDDRPDGIIGRFEYSTDLFEQATIRRMLRHWYRILEEFVRDPSQLVSTLPLLSDADRRQQLVDWNATSAPYPRESTVHGLFEAQARNRPEAVALIAGAERVTYGELNERANQLARHLARLGVEPGTVVGICLDRTPELVASMIAVLKAGGTYLPLDPGYPAGRLAFMLEDARAAVMITTANLAPSVNHGLHVLCLDAGLPVLTDQPTGNLDVPVDAQAIAYVMYTSGSTGKPKGVEIPHRAITRLVFGVDYVQLGASRTLLQVAPASFDASTFELWGALLHGGRCVLLADRVPTAGAISAAIRDHGVDTVWLTASLFNAIVDTAPKSLLGIRQLLIGGEALSRAHVERALELLPETTIVNGYGPTECTTFACCYPIPRDLAPGTIPVGRPIGNTQAYILDEHGHLLPVGAGGELYVGGDGLARGYLNRPALTAERFVQNPLSNAGGRLYRTGDRARFRNDGLIQFLGRVDDQLKIRGFRVEPGEIEATLGQHPHVREALVLAREDRPGDKRLVAYVVLTSPISADDLTRFLQQRLPEYMVPSAMVCLDALPVAPSGKVDRAALPAPPDRAPSAAREVAHPRDTLEATLASLFEELLEVPEVGIDDNFFALGGHSLLAVRLLAKMRDALGEDVPLSCFWEDATVSYLASVIRRERPSVPSASALVPLGTGTKRPFFCVAPVDGNAFRFVHLARQLQDDRPFYGLRATWAEEGLHKAEDVWAMAARYAAEVRAVQPNGPYLLGGYSYGGAVAYELAQCLVQSGQEVAFLGMLDSGPTQWGSAPSGWSIKALAQTLENVPFWLREAGRRTPQQWRDSFKQEASVLLLRARSIALHEKPQNLPVRLEDIWDMGSLPPSYQQFLERQYSALKNYRLHSYPGRLTLFRARSQSLLRPQDRYLGWSALADTALVIVPGSHLSIVRDPHAAVLAQALGRCLREAESGQTVFR